MRQLLTLIWLKWRLFRNSLRTSKAVANRIAGALLMLAALTLALMLAFGLGVVAYALSSPELVSSISELDGEGPGSPSPEFIFFAILGFCYLLWSTLPLSMGSTRHFDPGNLLLYPISLRKLFAVDLVSEIASLQSILAVPAILAMGLGVGLARGAVVMSVLIALLAAVFGIALSKWISVSLRSVFRRKRARGETLLALLGVIVGLGGALVGQIAPVLFRHAESFRMLRWTPPGLIAYAWTLGLDDGPGLGYLVAATGLFGYAVLLIVITYWLSRRIAFGSGGSGRARQLPLNPELETYTGWKLPLLSSQLSAVVEKEMRYLLRNAQVRIMILMPMILIVLRLINRRRFGQVSGADGTFAAEFFKYGEGLIATLGVFYVFLILAGLFCNGFAFERGGMRALILSPLERKTILMGKNIAVSILALIFSAALLAVNELVFRDLTPGALLFAAFNFLIFMALMSVMGNWLSIRFPKRMKFGKRLNVSGVVGLLIIPMIFVLAVSPLAATAAGYVAQSLLIEYVTLAVLSALSIGFYLLVIDSQGESLQRREREILEAVNEPDNA